MDAGKKNYKQRNAREVNENRHQETHLICVHMASPAKLLNLLWLVHISTIYDEKLFQLPNVHLVLQIHTRTKKNIHWVPEAKLTNDYSHIILNISPIILSSFVRHFEILMDLMSTIIPYECYHQKRFLIEFIEISSTTWVHNKININLIIT